MTKKRMEKRILQLERELSELKSQMLTLALSRNTTFIPVFRPAPLPPYQPLIQPQINPAPWPSHWPTITCDIPNGTYSSSLARIQDGQNIQ
jgi:hypothetical protein